MGKGESCCVAWCCPGRLGWFRPIIIAAVIAMAIFSVVTSIVAYNVAKFSTSQSVYTLTGVTLATSTANHVMAGATVMQLNLPNNLVEYAGASYVVDCLTVPAHTLRILPGTLSTTWDGINKVAHCVQGGGFRFRVVTSSFVRLESVTGGVTFSP